MRSNNSNSGFIRQRYKDSEGEMQIKHPSKIKEEQVGLMIEYLEQLKELK